MSACPASDILPGGQVFPPGAQLDTISRRAILGSVAAAGALGLTRGDRARAAGKANTIVFDAASMGGLSIVNRLDSALDYEPYFHLDIASDPPEGVHSSWDYVDTAGRYVGAFIRLRKMGFAIPTDSEAGLRRFFLANQHSDGLFYDGASPWSEELAETFAQSRAMFGLVEWFLESGESAVQDRIEALITGLSRTVEPVPGGVAFPGRQNRGGMWLDRTLTAAGAADQMPKPGYGALVADPLIKYAVAANSAKAKQLAEQLVGGFVGLGAVGPGGAYLGHTHSWGILPTAVAMLELAILNGREDLLSLARGVYDFTISQGTHWGWIPDGVGFAPGYVGALFCETCGLADVVNLGIRLATLGHPTAWDEVNRIVRNQLVENQFRDVSLVISPDSAARSHTGAANILRGSFDAWARPTNLLGGLQILDHGGLEACCTGSAMAALQVVASSAVARHDGAIWVELPFVHNALADVESFEPDEGRLVVTPREAGPLRVRLPEGASTSLTRATIDGVPFQFGAAGRVLYFDAVGRGQSLELSYPLSERYETRTFGGVTATARWRGTTVVDMDPPGEKYPTYRHRLGAV